MVQVTVWHTSDWTPLNNKTVIDSSWLASFNSLAPGKFEWKFRHVIFQQILVVDGWGISCEIVLIWKSLDFTDDQSTLVQVMAWCRQAASHCMNQCWPRSLPPYGVTRPCYGGWYSLITWLTIKWPCSLLVRGMSGVYGCRTGYRSRPSGANKSAWCRLPPIKRVNGTRSEYGTP